MGKRNFVPSAFFAVLVLVMGFVASATAMSGQGTPVTVTAPETDTETTIVEHPVHIHSGTCDELGEVVYPLNSLQAAAQVASPEASPVVASAATPGVASDLTLGDAAAQSATEVDVSLEDLLADEFAINVHESPENIQNYIACGEITGSPENGELFVELQELNGSGFAGQAELADQGDGTTIVHVTIFPSVTTGTPEATPSS